MGGKFWKELGSGEIIRPALGIDIDARSMTPEQKLRLQAAQNQMAQQQAERRAMSAAGQAMAPITKQAPLPGTMGPVTYSLPSGDDSFLTPPPPAGQMFPEVRPYPATPSIAEMMQSSAIRSLPPEEQLLAASYLDRFAKPTKVPEDIQHEQQVRATMAAAPGLSKEDAEAAVTSAYAKDAYSLVERRAEASVREAFRKGEVIDPATGLPAEANTPSGARARANYAQEHGATKLASFYDAHATRMKDQAQEKQRERADKAAVPAIERATRLLNTPMSDAQRTELAAAIAATEADPVRGLPRLQAASQNIQKSSEQATAEARRERARVERQKVQEAQIRHIDSLTAKTREGGSAGTAARLQLAALRTTTSNQRAALERQLTALTDPMRKASDLGTDDETRQDKIAEVRDKLAKKEEELARIAAAQEQQVPSGILAPPAVPEAPKKRYKFDPATGAFTPATQ